MRLSELDQSALYELTDEQVNEIVYGPLTDDGASYLCALLLGGNPMVLRERAQGAAQLYASGRTQYIIPTGGVEWDTEYGHMSEAKALQRMLQEYGVPESAIILENEARTTRENMILGELQMERSLRPRGPFRVCIVSSPSHLRRSLLLARTYLPRTAILSVYPGVCPQGMKHCWYTDENQRERVYRELELLHQYISTGEIEDVEY